MRLTEPCIGTESCKRYEHFGWSACEKCEKNALIYKRLAEFEAAEERGLLIIKPDCDKCAHKKRVYRDCAHCAGMIGDYENRFKPRQATAALKTESPELGEGGN